jgi:hypothetical protein
MTSYMNIIDLMCSMYPQNSSVWTHILVEYIKPFIPCLRTYISIQLNHCETGRICKYIIDYYHLDIVMKHNNIYVQRHIGYRLSDQPLLANTHHLIHDNTKVYEHPYDLQRHYHEYYAKRGDISYVEDNPKVKCILPQKWIEDCIYLAETRRALEILRVDLIQQESELRSTDSS